jgi:hypothetical protein
LRPEELGLNLDLDEVLICGFQSSVVDKKKKQSCPAALVDNFAKICISLFLPDFLSGSVSRITKMSFLMLIWWNRKSLGC